MDIELYRSFLEIARCGSIAKASEKLHLSHPALSKQLRRLESHYGVVLFHRSPGGVELTEGGRLLCERIPAILDGLQAIEESLARLRVPGRLRLGALPSLAAHYLPPALGRMEQMGLASDLLIRHTSEELREALETQAVQAAVMELSASSRLWSAELLREGFCVVLRSDHPLARSASLRANDLAGEALVMYPPSCGIRARVSDAFGAHGLQPCIRMEVPFGDFLLGYAAAGTGSTIVPETAARRLPAPLVCVPLDEPLARRTVSLVSADHRLGRLLLPMLQKSRDSNDSL
ncbi:LysR family transcriptional regulator [Paenibacillus sp. S-38]|uniref:LysR family transcriptional regulator n=1 Tax=Paenibacillus sp. S-38 TaxID=3416710 RepID=UPI003CE6DA45